MRIHKHQKTSSTIWSQASLTEKPIKKYAQKKLLTKSAIYHLCFRRRILQLSESLTIRQTKFSFHHNSKVITVEVQLYQHLKPSAADPDGFLSGSGSWPRDSVGKHNKA
jgi:hypothetical protein